MICNNCGMFLNETVRFCSGCGLSIGFDGCADVQTEGIGATAGPSPVSALFIDPSSSQSSLTVTCVIHSASVAAGACVGCGNFYCRDCLISHGGKNYCGNCVARITALLPQNVPTYQYQQAGTSLTAPLAPQPYHYPQQSPHQSQMQPSAYARPAMPYVKRKEPAVALLLSFFLPGVGQIY